MERAHLAEVQRQREETRKKAEADDREAKLKEELKKQQEEAARVRAANEAEKLRLEKEADAKKAEESEKSQAGIKPSSATIELAECEKILTVSRSCHRQNRLHD